MYIILRQSDHTTFELDRGDGPRLPGQYMSGDLWRLCSTVIANLASRLSVAEFVIIRATPDVEAVARINALNPGRWYKLSEAEFRAIKRSGVYTDVGDASVWYIADTREQVEDVYYRALGYAEAFILPPKFSFTSMTEIGETLAANSLAVIDADDEVVIVRCQENVVPMVRHLLVESVRQINQD